MAQLLLVDPDEALMAPLSAALEGAGHTVDRVEGVQTALSRMRSERPPDLVALELGLPDGPGTDICRHVRATPGLRELPLMILSWRGEEIDRIVGFEVGADDYVTKPFSTREVALRVNALLRRCRSSSPRPAERVVGWLRVQPEERVAWVKGERVELTAVEARLLANFATKPGRAWSRPELLDAVWGAETDVDPRTIDVHIRRLRQKLGPCAEQLQTVRGRGYRLARSAGSGT